MARFSRKQVGQLVALARNGATSHAKGRALQDLVCHLFAAIPGVRPPICNIVDFAEGGEIDVFCANKGQDNGLWFLPRAILIECKNWTEPVGSQEVRVFIDRMKERACEAGILIAANGVTGNDNELNAARRHISRAQEDRYEILVVTLEELAVTPGLCTLGPMISG
jgi:hypothetical protein